MRYIFSSYLSYRTTHLPAGVIISPGKVTADAIRVIRPVAAPYIPDTSPPSPSCVHNLSTARHNNINIIAVISAALNWLAINIQLFRINYHETTGEVLRYL